MFDDRLVFETPGKLPGIVRTDNIRHTHFSRNPKIAEYLKAYDYVKEFGEGVDRMCRELSAIGTKEPHYHLVAFIMKATVWANVLEEGQEKGKNLPDRFTSEDMQALSVKLGKSIRTIQRQVRRAIQNGQVKELAKGRYEKL